MAENRDFLQANITHFTHTRAHQTGGHATCPDAVSPRIYTYMYMYTHTRRWVWPHEDGTASLSRRRLYCTGSRLPVGRPVPTYRGRLSTDRPAHAPTLPCVIRSLLLPQLRPQPIRCTGSLSLPSSLSLRDLNSPLRLSQPRTEIPLFSHLSWPTMTVAIYNSVRRY